MKDEVLKVIGAIFLIILLIFVAPWITFWLCYFAGWIAKILIGNYLVGGFSIFKIDLPLDKIPLLAGTLGWIGSFFKNTINLGKKD